VREDTVKTKIRAELTRKKGVQVMDHDPSRQQVRVPASKLPCARSRQQESEPARMGVDDGLDAVQQRGNPLNLVDENGSGRWGRGAELPLEPFGLRDKLSKRGEARQVQRDVRFKRAKERRLPDLARLSIRSSNTD
jgi:hypothetical protein